MNINIIIDYQPDPSIRETASNKEINERRTTLGVREKRSVEAQKLYKAARTQESVCREYGIDIKKVLKLAGNENRFGCSPRVVEELEKRKGEFSYYPDFNVSTLRKSLSDKLGAPEESFIFGNGSFELISLIGAAFIDEGDEAIYADPSFGWYINVTTLNGGKVVKVPVNKDFAVDSEAILKAITERTKVVWLCNPNNPTGTVLPGSELVSLISRIRRDILIVLDEAYIDFIDEEANGGPYIDTVKLTEEYDNLIILRTFSKSYGLASFRIGYGIASEAIIDSLTKVRLPMNTTFASHVAAEAALSDEDFKNYIVRKIDEERKYYYEALKEFGFTAVRSNGNFIFVHTGRDGGQIEEALLRQGIMIRNGAEFGFRDYVRISIGTHEENERVIAALREVLKDIPVIKEGD